MSKLQRLVEPDLDPPPLPPLPSPVAILRSLVRLVLIIGLVLVTWVEYWLFVRRLREGKAAAQARWLHSACQRALLLLCVRHEVLGTRPSEGLIVSNHLSYLDIIFLSATSPFTFVSKAEVANWPMFGLVAKCGGTIFIDRQRRGDVLPVGEMMRALLRAHVPVVLFPEGTSSGGESVLPFKPALLAPVADLGCPVTPCAIDYHLPGGSVPDEVCFWGDDAFFPHLLNLLGKVDLRARITFGEPHPVKGDRKELAKSLHEEVNKLRAKRNP